MTEEQKTKNHYEMLNNSSNKSLVDLIKMQDNKITDLENKLANADYQLEGREVELKELQETYKKQRNKRIDELQKKNHDLEEQIEKLLDFVIEHTECCDVCPMTDTCINDEGTCPYAGILAKGEEEVTREWLMQFISKEIKEYENN